MRFRWISVAVLIAAQVALHAPGTAVAQTGAVSTPHEGESGAQAALRIGMLHPLPHLCVGQEAWQRDLRVLRLAYGVALAPAERVAWPWYLALDGRRISLREDALFGPSPAKGLAAGSDAAGGVSSGGISASSGAAVGPAQDGLASDGSAGGLALWLESVQAEVPALSAELGASGGSAAAGLTSLGGPAQPVLRINTSAADPWLASRMNGSALLPYRDEWGVARPCRSWPAGVEFLPGRAALEGGRMRYVLRRRAGRGLPAFTLTGYGNPGALWADFGAGRLDVALLDSGALKADEAVATGSAGGVWGVQAGTQQVILRLNPKWEAARTVDLRRALSQAINRPALAGSAERGAFRAARQFLEPVLAEGRGGEAGGRGGEAEVLGWDSRLARKQWLANAGASSVRRLRLAVLSHPLLEVFARRLAGQWQTTLGIVAVPELVDADRLLQAWNSGAYDALLDVVELDDGSLQDLWSAAIGTGERGNVEPPTPAQLAAWEAKLRQDVPYLPLLTGVQYVLARGEGATEHLRQVCPGCASATAPPSSDN